MPQGSCLRGLGSRIVRIKGWLINQFIHSLFIKSDGLFDIWWSRVVPKSIRMSPHCYFSLLAFPKAAKAIAKRLSNQLKLVVANLGNWSFHFPCLTFKFSSYGYPRFAPLLDASQRYAAMSGCRFRADSFADLPMQLGSSQQATPSYSSSATGIDVAVIFCSI